jgi:hypothetical protein
MLADLGRYFYAALYGQIANVSPKAKDFPRQLAPDHRNWETGKRQKPMFLSFQSIHPSSFWKQAGSI